MKTLILTLILTAQATSTPFQAFISEFNADTNSNYTGTISFGETKSFESAVANLRSDTPYNSNIAVNEKLWKNYNHSERRWLMYHELAHAAFGAPHNNALLDDGCPAHFMHSETLKSPCIRRHETLYLNQLRNIKSLKGTKLDVYVKVLKVK